MSSFSIQNAALPYRNNLSKDIATSTVDAVDKEPVMDRHDREPVDEEPFGSLEAPRDARQIIRLMQCPACSYPLQEPVTLPCGNSICKKCIPETHPRQLISYPASLDRLPGFSCPIESCGLDHAVVDSGMDVILNKIMVLFENVIDKYRTLPEAMNISLELIGVAKGPKTKASWQTEREENGQVENKSDNTGLEEKEPSDDKALGGNGLQHKQPQVFPGGRLIATYTMAEIGELAYDMDVKYTYSSGTSECHALNEMDIAVMEHFKEAVSSELECQVCYSSFLDPFTTPCGHTFCRVCLNQVLNHSTSVVNYCPLCRRSQAIPPGVRPRDAPSNKLLSELQSGFCLEALASRLELAEQDPPKEEPNVPLFICTLSFPTMPTFLHVFEPRYRLMIRRVLESSKPEFGMLLHNPTKEPQGGLGRVHFYQYGTMLQIRNIQILIDGRSVIETYGTSRFRVLSYSSLDGYTIGKIERIDDLSLAGEEALEAQERSHLPQTHLLSPIPQSLMQERLEIALPVTDEKVEIDDKLPAVLDINTMSTMGLFLFCLAYVKQKDEQSETWLHRRVFQVYGECPDDPSKFPWWFASVLPTSEEQKYRLLATTTVRERLKITAEWVQSIEAQRWNSGSGSSCTVL